MLLVVVVRFRICLLALMSARDVKTSTSMRTTGWAVAEICPQGCSRREGVRTAAMIRRR